MKKETTKQNKKSAIREIREIVQCLDELITEGINIKKQADPDLLEQEYAIYDLLIKEQLWYEKVKELWFNQEELYKITDIRALYKSHRMVPWMISLPGSLEYRDKENKKSQELLEKIRIIRINAGKVSQLLLEVKSKLLKKIPEGFLACNGLKFDLDSGEAVYGETEVILRKDRAMYKLLAHFLKNQNEPVSKEDALKVLYPRDYKMVSSPYRQEVKNHVNNIRKKLKMSGKNKKNEDLFESMGHGSYRLNCKE